MTACAKDGCRAPAIGGKRFCYWHDPEAGDRRREASRRGGRAPRRISDLSDVRPTLDTPEKIAAVVESYVGGLASGKATAAQVNAVCRAADVLLKAHELADVERRIDRLEAFARSIEEDRIRVSQ